MQLHVLNDLAKAKRRWTVKKGLVGLLAATPQWGGETNSDLRNVVTQAGILTISPPFLAWIRFFRFSLCRVFWDLLFLLLLSGLCLLAISWAVGLGVIVGMLLVCLQQLFAYWLALCCVHLWETMTLCRCLNNTLLITTTSCAQYQHCTTAWHYFQVHLPSAGTGSCTVPCQFALTWTWATVAFCPLWIHDKGDIFGIMLMHGPTDWRWLAVRLSVSASALVLRQDLGVPVE